MKINTLTKVASLILMSVFLIGCAPMYQQKGYANETDYNFSQTIGNATPARIAALKSYGVFTRQAFDQVTSEMKAQNYSQKDDWNDILAYLKDRKDASTSGRSVLQQREYRVAEERKIQQQRAEEARRKREEFARKYPYEAILACEFQGRSVGNLAVCFVGGRGSNGTELSLRNGDSVRVYKGYELQNLGREQPDGLHIPLRERFAIRAQNESKNYILTLTIKSTLTGKVLNKQAAGMWKVVSVRN